MKDPFVSEIRKSRRKLDRLMERDPDALKVRLQATEEKYKDLMVDLNLRPVVKSPRGSRR